jgi:hypothetical protein
MVIGELRALVLKFVYGLYTILTILVMDTGR